MEGWVLFVIPQNAFGVLNPPQLEVVPTSLLKMFLWTQELHPPLHITIAMNSY